MDPDHFLRRIIRPALAHLGAPYNTNAAAQLMLGTALAETRLEFLHQIGGPGRGFYSIEPATHRDIWRFLGTKMALHGKVTEMAPKWLQDDDRLYCGFYSTAIARVRYLYVPEEIPRTVEGAAIYWKTHFNTPAGAGTVEHYLDNWKAAH